MSGIRQFEAYCKRSRNPLAFIALIMLRRFFATVPPNNAARRGQHHDIPEEYEDRVLELYNTGTPQHEIAHSLKVNQGRVNEVIKGRTR